MLFFSFEAVSCFISQGSIDNGQCYNTNLASMILSMYLIMVTLMSIFSKAVPERVRAETDWSLSKIATLHNLKWWQQLEGGFMAVTAIATLYLLGALGVEGDYNQMLLFIGASGSAGVTFAAVIGGLMLISILKRADKKNEEEENKRQGKTQACSRVSSGTLEDQMIIAGII